MPYPGRSHGLKAEQPCQPAQGRQAQINPLSADCTGYVRSHGNPSSALWNMDLRTSGTGHLQQIKGKPRVIPVFLHFREHNSQLQTARKPL